MPSRFSVLVAALVVAVQLHAQNVGPESVVQAPEMVVSEGALPADAAGTTRAELDPANAAGLDTWDFLNQAIPNFHADEGGAEGFGTLFTMRGLANTPYFSEPSVTVYYADIPLGASFTYPGELANFAAAALYAGPQGTAFGRATDGGVLVLTPPDYTGDAAPGAADGSGRIAAGFGSYSEREVEAMGGGGSVDLGAEAAASYEARNGYIFNTELGRPVDDEEHENAFSEVRFRAGPNLVVTAEGFATRDRDGAQPVVPLGSWYTVSRAAEGVTDLDSWGAAVKAVLSLPEVTVTSVTSATDWRMNPYTDYLVLPPPLDSLIDQDQKNWNEELHAIFAAWGRLQARTGAWLSKGTTDNLAYRTIGFTFPYEYSGFEQRAESAAAFGQLVFTPAPGWTLTAGVRAETDRKDFNRWEEVPTPGLTYDGRGRYGAMLPKLAADWSPSATVHAELSASWGLRPGGFSSYTDNPAYIPFAAERVAALGAGWDWTSQDRTLEVAARGFYDRIGNYQIERSFTEADYFVATAARAHTDGAEVQASWRPEGGWVVALSAGETEARLDQYASPITGQNLSGNRAPYVPRTTADLEAGYRPNVGWFAAGDLAETGRTDYDELQTPYYEQGGYATVGARAGYQSAAWTVTVSGENLAGRKYYTLIIPGVESAAPGAPRTWGVTVERRW